MDELLLFAHLKFEYSDLEIKAKIPKINYMIPLENPRKKWPRIKSYQDRIKQNNSFKMLASFQSKFSLDFQFEEKTPEYTSKRSTGDERESPENSLFFLFFNFNKKQIVREVTVKVKFESCFEWYCNISSRLFW